MLTCAIVYATPHTNARRLAETMYAVLGPQQCIYMGMMDDQCLLADVIFWGGNTDTVTPEIEEFLEKIKDKIVIPFGDMCKGGAKDLYAIVDYASRVMENIDKKLREMELEKERNRVEKNEQ